MKRYLICLLAILMLLTSCGKKVDPDANDPSKNNQQPVNKKGETLTDDGVFTSNDAFTFSPCEGVTIDVPANALYGDTVIKMEPVSEDTPHIKVAIEELKNQDIYALRAWEIDADLEENERLPGDITISVDLNELGIDSSLWDGLSIMRIGDDGELTEINSRLDGNKLVYSTSRNSVETMVFHWAHRQSIVVGLDVIEVMDSFYYLKNLVTKGQLFYIHQYNSDVGSFRVIFSDEDLDPDIKEKSKRLNEIKESYTKKIRNDTTIQKRASWDVFGLFSSNETEAQLVKKALEKDEEYQKLLKQIKTPDMYVKLIEFIKTSFEFLGRHEKIRLPEYAVNIYVKDDLGKAYGTSSWNWFDQPYIEVSMRDAKLMNETSAKGAEARDNFLLTLTHELFHVCQEEYHTHFFSDSVRFDEMTAVVIESDAFKYYKENGIITTTPALTNQDDSLWGWLDHSIDDNDLSKDPQTGQGYILSLFVDYLREVKGESVPVSKIMDARSYWKKPVASKILSQIFNLTEEEFEKHWIGFCKKYMMRAGEALTSSRKIDTDDYVHFDTVYRGDYTMRVVPLKQDPQVKNPMLVIPDNIAELDSEHAVFIPTVEHSRYTRGYYIPAEVKEITANSNRRWIAEIYGKASAKTLSGYKVWTFGQTKKVTLDVDYTKDIMLINMDEHSNLALSGDIDGYYIKLTTNNGYHTETYQPVKQLTKGLSITFEKLYNGDSTRDVIVSVTATEYVADAEGNKYYGVESEPTLYTLRGLEPDDDDPVDDPVIDNDPLSEREQWINGMAFGYPLEFRLYYINNNDEGIKSQPVYDMLQPFIGQTMTIDDGGHFSFSIPSITGSRSSTGYTCTYTLSYTFSGHMVPTAEAKPDWYPNGWDENLVDWKWPVLDGGIMTRHFVSHEQGVYNGGESHYTTDIETDFTSDEVKLIMYTTVKSRSSEDLTRSGIEGLEEDRDYLVITLNIQYRGQLIGEEVEWLEYVYGIGETTHHREINSNNKYYLYLCFVSTKPVAYFIRELYEH